MDDHNVAREATNSRLVPASQTNRMLEVNESDRHHLSKHLPWISKQGLFVTKEGYMGIGPNWLQAGDGVFLIPGGSTPYIFAHIDQVLQRQADRIRQRLSKMPPSKSSRAKKKELETELQEIEAKIGQKDGWQLVGEAYVEGVMHGEVASEIEEHAQRYSIV
ncbi:hypothetical protein EK21DRAFT_108375 [Setomelanomma holmii]|uniref:Uncharacterized protein n=1 Tax=Setomelanomma holmii TaxID=210430 RepID=A0A9P4HGC8_9PLEO|nr:hypothetical protein EK21DRAFT_108375 [Setomelanomma holmii]